MDHSVGTALYTENYDSATNTLTISFNEAVSTHQVFTYQTAINTDAYIQRLASSNNLSISNSAEIVFPNSETIPSGNSSISYTSYNFV